MAKESYRLSSLDLELPSILNVRYAATYRPVQTLEVNLIDKQCRGTCK